MTTIALKLLKDFRFVKGKLLLSILAAALSAWGVAGVYYSYRMSERDFAENFTAANPADLVLRIENCTLALLEKLSENKSIAQLERREVFSGRVKNAKGRWMPLMIQAVEPFQRPGINKFKVLETIGPAVGSVFIEKNGASFLDLSNGEMVVQTGGADSLHLKLGGYVHDPGLPPAQMERMVYAYLPMDAAAPYLSKTQQRWLVKTTDKRPTGARLQAVADTLKTLIAQNGGALTAVAIPPPGEHPHQNIVNGVAFLQKTSGFVLCLLGVALLSLVLLSWLYPQIPQIGILKAVGSSTRKIIWAYFAVLSLIVVAGLLIGMPIGYQTALAYNRFIAFIQNFTPVRDPLPGSAHLIAAAAASAIPLAFCIPPLIRASGVSVQQALSAVFHTPQKGIFRVLQNGPVGSRLKYGLHNLFRNSGNTALLILILAVGTGLFFTGGNLRYSINKDLAGYFESYRYEHTFYLADSQQVSTDFLKQLPFVESVATGLRRSAVYLSPAKGYPDNATLQTLSAEYRLAPELLISGKIDPNCDNCVYINNMHGRNFKDTPLGTPLPLVGQKGDTSLFVLAGVIKELTAGPGFYFFSKQALPAYDEIFVDVKTGYPPAEAAERIEAALLEKGIKVAQVSDVGRRLEGLEAHLAPSFLIIQVMGLFTILIGLAGLVILLSLAIEERANEIGILKAVGGSTQQIIGLFCSEFLAIYAIAIALGAAGAVLSTPVLCKLFGNMLLETGFHAFADLRLMILTSALLPLLLIGLIVAFGRRKIGRKVRVLLG
jgi:putative ABC transport system permease protein